jgi:hypothetical protein
LASRECFAHPSPMRRPPQPNRRPPLASRLSDGHQHPQQGSVLSRNHRRRRTDWGTDQVGLPRNEAFCRSVFHFLQPPVCTRPPVEGASLGEAGGEVDGRELVRLYVERVEFRCHGAGDHKGAFYHRLRQLRWPPPTSASPPTVQECDMVS